MTRFLLSIVLSLSVAVSAAAPAAANPARLAAMEKLEGLHERRNRKTIRSIIGVDPVRTPWCGAAAAYAVKKAGGRPPAEPLRAISWKRFGKGVSLASARKGDIVVLRFKRGYHVGVFRRHLANGRVEVCGGNTSNSFKCTGYRAANVKAVRR